MPRTPKNLDLATVLRRNRADALSLVSATGKDKTLALLRRATDDLTKRLANVRSGDDSFTAVQLEATRRQLQDVTRVLVRGLGDVVLDQAGNAADQATGDLLRYMGAAHRKFRGIGDPPLALHEASMLDTAVQGARASVLRRLATSGEPGAAEENTEPHAGKPGILQRYGLQTIEHFEGILQTAFVARQPWSQVRDALTQASPFLQGAPAHWAERIVRTETMGAYNRAGWEATRVADAQLGDMVKILCATFDERTGWDSYQVHGQVRRPNEAFEWDGGLYQHPPNRPNDREVVVPHRLSWPLPEELEPYDDDEVEEVYYQQRPKGPGPGPRPNMSTVDRALFGQAQPGGLRPDEEPERQPEPPPEVAPPPEQQPEPVEPEPRPPVVVDGPLPNEAGGVVYPLQPERLPDGSWAFTDADGNPVQVTTPDVQRQVEWSTPENVQAEAAQVFAPKLDGADVPYAAVMDEVLRHYGYDANVPEGSSALNELCFDRAEAAQLRYRHLSMMHADPVSLDAGAVAAFMAKRNLRGLKYQPVVVKHDGEYYVHSNAERLLAGKRLEAQGYGSAYQDVRLLDLDKLKPAVVVPPEQFVNRLSGALDRFDTTGKTGKGKPHDVQREVRITLSEYLRGHGLESRDDLRAQHDGFHSLISPVLDPAHEQYELKPNPALGTHEWGGRITMDPFVHASARAELADLATMPRGWVPPAKDWASRGLKTVIHEAIHGASPGASGAYRGIGVGLEEGLTEILARKLTRELVPAGGKAHNPVDPNGVLPIGQRDDVKSGGGTYQNYVHHIVTVVHEATARQRLAKSGGSVNATLDRNWHDAAKLVERAAAETRRWRQGDSVAVNTPEEHVRRFVDALHLDPSTSTVIRDRLNDPKQWP